LFTGVLKALGREILGGWVFLMWVALVALVLEFPELLLAWLEEFVSAPKYWSFYVMIIEWL